MYGSRADLKTKYKHNQVENLPFAIHTVHNMYNKCIVYIDAVSLTILHDTDFECFLVACFDSLRFLDTSKFNFMDR